MQAIPSKLLHETIVLASALIRLPSFNPPGNEDAIMAFAGNWLENAGISSESVPLGAGRSSLVARVPGSQAGSVVLCGHLDTVTANEDAWQRHPLEPVVEDGRLWGLGATDMKSGVAVLMQTMAQRAALSLPPEKSLVLVLTADEEWGYRGAETVAKSEVIDDAELILIAEPTSNAVYVGQKGELWIETSFAGKEAHGSMPASGTSAILPAAQFCTQLQEELSRWPEDPKNGRTTLNIGRFDGGRQVNIVPSHALIHLDVRPICHEHALRVMKTVEELGRKAATAAGCSFSHRKMCYHPPIHSDTNHSFARKLITVSCAATGEPQPLGLSPYSTDAVSIVPKLDVPILICGPGSIKQAHQPNEYIELSSVEDALLLWEHLLTNL